MEDSFMETGVESTPEYNQVLNTLLASELTTHTNQIMYALEDEYNKTPLEIINPKVNKGNGVFAEINKENTMIRLNVLDKANERQLSVAISAIKDHPYWISVEQQTFDRIKILTKDPEVCLLNVERKLKKAK
ncbi:MAG: hypothetical protein PHE21_01285 [Candidatus Dojkabacteria bacterium]|nr:hypothetical protein [Candidatus Dojkabacteria bacterium]